MPPLATKCVRGKGSSSAVLTSEALRVGVRWRMPPLATKCDRGKGSSGVQVPRSASQVNACTKNQNVDESLRLLNVVRATCIPPSNYTLKIMVELFRYARRLNQAFQCIEGRRGCVSASCL